MRKLLPIATAIALLLSVCVNRNVLVAQDQGRVIADGLNGPMGVLMDETGTLWVIESGTGGETDTPFVDTQSGEPITANYGETAQVLTISPDGAKTVVTALPSVATGADIIGGARLATLNGKVYATVGQWLGDPTAEAGLANMGVVAEIKQGSATAVASTWDFERKQNPDGLVTDSHPYGLSTSPEGTLLIADAGGNALLAANPITGRVRLIAVFEGIPAPFPNPARNNENLTDPVPTAVVAKDGLIFVSLLSGFPFTPGSAKVVTVDGEGNVSDYATNLTMLTDLQLGPDNELYAVQFAEFGESGPTPNSGALVRIAAGNSSEVVLSGLSFPTAVTFTGDGDAYLALNGVGAPGSGQVVLYTGITTASALETVDTAAVAAASAVTETTAMTATMTMTDTLAMTDTTITTGTSVMRGTVAGTVMITETAALTDTTAMSDSLAMTETLAMTATMAMTDTAALPVKEADPAGTVRESDTASAPEALPITGSGSADAFQTTVPVVALILLALAASAVATRRRQA